MLNSILNGLGQDPELDLSMLSGDEIAQLEDAVDDGAFDGHPALGRIRRNVRTAAGRSRTRPSRPTASRQAMSRPSAGGASSAQAPGRGPAETKDTLGKALIENRLNEINDGDIKGALKNQTLTGADYAVYSQRLAEGTRVELFQPGDKKGRGVTNINSAKLSSNKAFLVQSIIILAGVNADPTGDELGRKVDFQPITPEIANGDISLKNGQKVFWEDSSLSVFAHKGNDSLLPGEYKLEVPKMIDPRAELVCDLDLASATAANTHIKVILKGTATIKA